MATTRLAVRTNGATLSYKKKSESTYTVLEGLQSIPEIGSEPEKIECTVLTSKNKLYKYFSNPIACESSGVFYCLWNFAKYS